MISVVQRVLSAAVVVRAQSHRAAIDGGLCVLLAVEQDDGPEQAAWMAGKLARLRIFRDGDGLMNRSVQDVHGEVLLVSQFTLAGDCSRGNRPSFVAAAPPDLGEALFDSVAQLLREVHSLPVQTGVFGAMMEVSLVNDGPVTLIVRSPRIDRNRSD